MNKSLNRSDYFLSLIFVFLLVCVAGAFFFGVEIGQRRAETKYTTLMAKEADLAKKPGAYEQQQLVSFYHTIYEPYRAFTDLWFDKMNALAPQGGENDPASVFKDLAKAADEQYAVLSKATAPLDTSPLLGEAHQNLLKGLKLFADAAKKFQAKANSLPPGDLQAEVDKDAFFQEAKKMVLQGEQQYYTSIVKWNETIDPQVKGASLLGQSSLTPTDWSGMSLNVKNAAVSTILLKEANYLPLYPQDITVRIDEWIASGQTQKMNLNDIGSVVDVLAETNAARKGDFAASHDKRYAGETTPQLPFFYAN